VGLLLSETDFPGPVNFFSAEILCLSGKFAKWYDFSRSLNVPLN